MLDIKLHGRVYRTCHLVLDRYAIGGGIALQAENDEDVVSLTRNIPSSTLDEGEAIINESEEPGAFEFLRGNGFCSDAVRFEPYAGAKLPVVRLEVGRIEKYLSANGKKQWRFIQKMRKDNMS